VVSGKVASPSPVIFPHSPPLSRAITIPARGAEIVTAAVPRYFRLALRFAFFAVFFLAARFFAAMWFPLASRRLVSRPAQWRPSNSLERRDHC
jgi:hypothetical protein